LRPPPTTVWGPHGWRFLHYVSLGYPNNPSEEDKINYMNFYQMIKNVLPCSVCSRHYEENYNAMPLTDEILSSKEKLVEWVITMHNIVNHSTGKRIIPLDEALELIDTDVKCAPVIKPKKSSQETSFYDTIPLIAILGILIVIAIVYKKK
jgi:hypothetical protein